MTAAYLAIRIDWENISDCENFSAEAGGRRDEPPMTTTLRIDALQYYQLGVERFGKRFAQLTFDFDK